jgi:hypothetical protein
MKNAEWPFFLPFPRDNDAIAAPYWFWMLIPAMIAVAPSWIRWRFRLRTLLIGTTVVAAFLGLVFAISR